MRNATPLETILGYTFEDSALLTRALTHRSFSNEHEQSPHNERLEFLGDTILQFVTTIQLFHLYPDEPEGVLSVYRSLVVKTDYLLRVADSLNLQEYLRVSEGQRILLGDGGGGSILADAVEALIGSIYLDGGIEPSQHFIETHVLRDVAEYLATIPLQDPKTTLQEIVQQDMHVTPEYEVLHESGLDHEKTFTVGVKIDGVIRGEAQGRSKQEAAQRAAQQFLDSYIKEGDE